MDNTYYRILENKKYSLSKKCLDTVEMKLGKRVIRIDPLMSSDRLVVSRNGKYLSDFMSLLYSVMVEDKSMWASSRVTNEPSILIMDRTISLTPPLGVSLNVNLPSSDIFSTDNATLVNYLFTRLVDRGYSYPLAIMNSKSNVGVIKDGRKYVLYLYLTTELKLERLRYSNIVNSKLDKLSTIGDSLDTLRRKAKMDYKTFSMILSIVRYSLLSVYDMNKVKKNLGVHITEESINDEVVYTTINVVENIYGRVDIIPIIEMMIKYLKSYRELVRMNKELR